MEFTVSRKGNAKLIIGGFSYVRDKIVKNTTYWKCDQFRICRSRVSTTNDRVNKGPSQHTHAPDLARIEAQKTIEARTIRTHTAYGCTYLTYLWYAGANARACVSMEYIFHDRIHV